LAAGWPPFGWRRASASGSPATILVRQCTPCCFCQFYEISDPVFDHHQLTFWRSCDFNCVADYLLEFAKAILRNLYFQISATMMDADQRSDRPEDLEMCSFRMAALEIQNHRYYVSVMNPCNLQVGSRKFRPVTPFSLTNARLETAELSMVFVRKNARRWPRWQSKRKDNGSRCSTGARISETTYSSWTRARIAMPADL